MENQKPSFVQENVSLKDFSAFKIGGVARFFCIVQNEDEIKAVLDFAVANRLKIFVLGAGSNLLFSDNGFDGLVIKMEDRDFEINEVGEGFEVRAGGGMYLSKMLSELVNKGISGLEWASGIPATVGGAVCNNAGTNSGDTAGIVKSVRAFKMTRNPEGGFLESYELMEIPQAACGFSYRNSIFKSNKDYLILDTTFSFKAGDIKEMQETIKKYAEDRIKKQPLKYPNIGSIFKNPALGQDRIDEILNDYPEDKGKFNTGMIPAGWLIEQVGLKGKKIGGVMVSGKHANFIVNMENGKAEDVMILISIIKQKVRTKFGIQLKEEIEYVGF